MSLHDRFRIDELVKRGSKAIPRNSGDGIVVRRVDKKEVKPTPVSLSDKPKPYGTIPIRGKQVEPKLKTDLLEPIVEEKEEQISFSGETSSHLERPYYDEEQLQKAVDVKVDELIKPKKQDRGRYIKYEKYEKVLEDIAALTEANAQLQSQLSEKDSIISKLEAAILGLESDVVAAQEALKQSEAQFESLKNRYEELLADFQNAVLKGTKEGIERVSLTAQVRGLGAQKETLASQLESERGIVKNLRGANETLQDTIRANQKIAEQQIAAANAQVKAAQATATTAANSKKKKIICNELYRQGYLPELIWDADERWGDKTFLTDPKLVIGYQMWARKVVEFMRRKPQYTPIIYFLCKPWTEWMVYDLGVLPKNNLRGQFTHFVGRYFSYMVYDLFGGKELFKRYNKVLG